MIKYLVFICCLVVAISSVKAQTLRIRSNSVENLHLVVMGTDKDGHKTSKTMYDFGGDTWKTLSFYETKYGYDAYHNKEMTHDGYDPTQRWTSIMVYDNSNTLYGTIDLSKPTKRASVGTTKVWAKIKQAYERDYLITDVILNDD